MKVLRGSNSDLSSLLLVCCSQQLIHTPLLAFSFFAFEATEFGHSCFGSSHVHGRCLIHSSRSNETRYIRTRSTSTV